MINDTLYEIPTMAIYLFLQKGFYSQLNMRICKNNDEKQGARACVRREREKPFILFAVKVKRPAKKERPANHESKNSSPITFKES